VIRYLLDTNVCTDVLKGSSPHLDMRLRQCGAGELGVSAITVFEFFYGAYKSTRVDNNRMALAAFFLPLELIPFDENAAAIAGEVRALLERAGSPIGANDLLIAAQALALSIIVVTNNEREFRRVPGLLVENWT
jgi:tRNA(fMet)-specific endonuclease VapC